MFIALDKMKNQGIKKSIIAVPEKSIGGSFTNTDLSTHGFFSDWSVKEQNNLCIEANDTSNAFKAFKAFLESEDNVLICTHSTLRNAFKKLDTNFGRL